MLESLFNKVAGLQEEKFGDDTLAEVSSQWCPKYL